MAGDPGPCDLVTADEVQNVLGEPVLAGERSDADCSFGRLPNEAGFSETAVVIRLEFDETEPVDLLDRYHDTLRATLGEYEPASVDELGVLASWDGDHLAVGLAFDDVRAAFVRVQLNVFDVGPDFERELAIGLAKLAVARLN